MDEYISREAVLEHLNKCKEDPLFDPDMARICFAMSVFIENMQAADVQPVKYGRWLKHRAIWIDQPEIEGWFVQAKCSECEKWAHVMNPYTKSVDYECCPHCSARMDLKDGDTNG